MGQSVSTAIINLLFFLFYKNAYGAKKKRRCVFVAVYLISTVVMMCVNQFGNQYINIAYSYISFNFICVALFNAKFRDVWLYNTLFWFFSAFCDTLTVLIWSVVKVTTLEGILDDYQLMLYSNLMNILLMFAIYRIYITIMKKLVIHAIQWKMALFMSTMTLFELFIIVSFAQEISSRKGGIKIIFISIGMIAINIFLSYIITQVSKAYKYRYELSLSERLCEMQLANYREIEQKYKEAKAMIHDMKKHMMVIDDLKDHKTDEYSQSVYERLDEIFCVFHCSSQILSIVMSQKISCAKAEKINVSVNVEEVPFDFMKDLDITAIFANLWDNAIEACQKIDGDRYINVKIGRVNDYIFVFMENNCDGNLKPSEQFFLSTKENHDGIGISSIKISVEKYNGYFSTEYCENTFKAEITIPIP